MGTHLQSTWQHFSLPAKLSTALEVVYVFDSVAAEQLDVDRCGVLAGTTKFRHTHGALQVPLNRRPLAKYVIAAVPPSAAISWASTTQYRRARADLPSIRSMKSWAPVVTRD